MSSQKQTASFSIPVDLQTLEHIKSLLQEISVMLVKRAHNSPCSAELELLLDANSSSPSSEVLLSLQAHLRQVLNEYRVVTITTAAPLEAEVKKQLVRWWQGTISEHILVSFKVSPQLIAGFIVQTPAHFYDHSLRGGMQAGNELLYEVVRP